jgi:hypothetical protein
MPQQRDLVKVEPDAISNVPGFAKVNQIEATFPKKTVTAAEFRKAQQDWVKSYPAPKATQPQPQPIKGVLLTAPLLDSLRSVHESTAATAELVGQQLGPDQTLAVVHSSLAAYEFTKMQAEYKKRLAAAKEPDKPAVQAQWQKVVEAAAAAHAGAGLKDLKEADLTRMASTLNSNKANFNAVATIANSAKDEVAVASAQANGAFVLHAEVLPDLVAIVITIPPTICDRPIQGSFSKHFSRSFQLQVTLTVWCPTWTNPFRTCRKTFTLAGVSFNVDLSVGYRITCCGATAWGQAAVQACASLLGIQVCASCTAGITAVAGTGKSASGSNCSYGLGLNAELKCQFAGITLFDVNAPFGWTITGPCLPPC